MGVVSSQLGVFSSSIEIIFPITIIHSDYSELYVNNAQELDANILGCNDFAFLEGLCYPAIVEYSPDLGRTTPAAQATG